jgi:uncharacterized membrane protein YhaH (DUF805 family)
MLSRIYLSPNGRCSRSFYWQFFVVPMFVLGALIGVLELFKMHFPALALLLLALWPSIIMQIKRLHDVNASGWWALLSLVPYLNLLTWLVFGLIPGTPGPNRFGPDPLGRSLAAVQRSNKTMEPTR